MPAFKLLFSSCGEQCFTPPTSYLLFSSSLPSDSPLPVIQRLRVGVEFVKCIRNNSGRLSTPFLYCRAGVVFQVFILDTFFHPRQQVINSSFPLVIRPHHRHVATVTTTSEVLHFLQRSAFSPESAHSPPHTATHYGTQPHTNLFSHNISEQCIWSVGSEW